MFNKCYAVEEVEAEAEAEVEAEVEVEAEAEATQCPLKTICQASCRCASTDPTHPTDCEPTQVCFTRAAPIEIGSITPLVHLAAGSDTANNFCFQTKITTQAGTETPFILTMPSETHAWAQRENCFT